MSCRGAAAALLLASMLASCTRATGTGAGAGKSAELKLMIWGAPDEVDVVRHYVQEFRRRRPDCRVTIQHAPSMGYQEKLRIRLAGGDPPDVFYVAAQDFEELAERGALLDLTPLAAKDRGFVEEDYFPPVLDAFRRSGRLHGVAKDFATLVLYYDRDLFDKWGVAPPTDDWTWKEFLAAAKALTHDLDGDGRTDEYGFVLETWFGEWAPWVWQNDGEIWDDAAGRLALGDPRYVDRNAEALQFLSDLIWVEGVAPKPSVTADFGTSDLFMTGRVAMCTYGRWMCMQFRSIRSFEWDCAVLPAGRRRATSLFPVCYAVSAETREPEAAWDLVRFLTGREGQVATAEAGQAIPSMRSVARTDHFLRPAALEGLSIDAMANLRSVPYARPAPRTRHFGELNNRATRALDAVWSGRRKARDVLPELQREVDDALRPR